MNIRFRLAKVEELDKVYDLYKSVQGTDFCVWDDEYPSFNDIKIDFENNNIYLYIIDKQIAGAISIIKDNELDELNCWEQKDNVKELARVCVDKKYQGYGIAKEMVLKIERVIYKRGIRTIHLLAAKNNLPAVQTYLNAGYMKLDEVFMFGHDYYAMEKFLEHYSWQSKAYSLQENIKTMSLCLLDKRIPFIAKTLSVLCVAYALSPIDLIPDFIPVLGYLDDLIILPLLCKLALDFIPSEIWLECRKKSKNLWTNGKPKKAIFALPIVIFWLLVVVIIVKTIFY